MSFPQIKRFIFFQNDMKKNVTFSKSLKNPNIRNFENLQNFENLKDTKFRREQLKIGAIDVRHE